MKKVFLTWMALFAAIVAADAQLISVVASNNTTTLYTDINLAIQGATAGSVVYLSGGGFQLNDSAKITKKLTIIGIGHRFDNDNADRNTIVSGNLSFESGSDNSALMGVYLSGNVNIGTGANAVNNILVRYCNINSIQIQNSLCQGVVINQNYIRGGSNGGDSPSTFSNNILHRLVHLRGGTVIHNVFTVTNDYSIDYAYDSNISNNINKKGYFYCSGTISNNTNQGDNAIVIDNWEDVFVGPDNGVSTTSNYALKGEKGKGAAIDGTDIGIYGGDSGFSDSALPPIPRIISKKIAEKTDENGKLKIQVQVKAQ